MTAASKYGSPRKLPCGGIFARRTRFPWGETGVSGEGMDTCNRGARRGMGPSAYARVAEIMSGRAIRQQGLASTCKDRACNGEPGGAGRGMVWRMSPYERRRGGNAPPGGLRGRLGAGNARSGQRGSGHSVAMTMGTQPDTELGILRGLRGGEGAVQTPRCRGEECASAAVSRRGGRPVLISGVQSRGQNRTREIRPSGIVGGLQETWPTRAEPGPRHADIRTWTETFRQSARAPDFYPDNRTYGLKGERGNRPHHHCAPDYQ